MSEPRLNLVVIRSTDLMRAQRFYESLGLSFTRHSHGTGPEHLASERDGMVFEIYPAANARCVTQHTRLGFRIADLENALRAMVAAGGILLVETKDSPWGRRAVVQDPDGHKIELLES